jgi:hypothetical protein
MIAPATMAPPTTPAAIPGPQPQPHPRPRHWAEASVAVPATVTTTIAAPSKLAMDFLINISLIPLVWQRDPMAKLRHSCCEAPSNRSIAHPFGRKRIHRRPAIDRGSRYWRQRSALQVTAELIFGQVLKALRRSTLHFKTRRQAMLEPRVPVGAPSGPYDSTVTGQISPGAMFVAPAHATKRSSASPITRSS